MGRCPACARWCFTRPASRCGSRSCPCRRRGPGRCGCGSPRAASAAPTSTSSTASCRSRSSRSSSGTRSSAGTEDGRRARHSRGSAGPTGRAATACPAARTSAIGAVHRLRPRRRLRRVGRRRRALLLADSRGVRRPAGCAAPLRRADRLPGAAARRRRASGSGLYGFGASAHIVSRSRGTKAAACSRFTRPGDDAAAAFALELGAEWAGASDEPRPEELDAAIIFAPVGALVPAALRAVAPRRRRSSAPAST